MTNRVKFSYIFCIIVTFLFAATCAAGQDYLYATGSPSFSTAFPVENGFINIGNGNLHFEIPMGSFKQRGNHIGVSLALEYDSRIWKIVQSGSSYSWQPTNVPNSIAGWRFVSGGESGSLSQKWLSTMSSYCATPQGGDGYQNIVTYVYTWIEPNGTRHDLNAMNVHEDSNCTDPYTNDFRIVPGSAIDASGYRLGDDGTGNEVVWDKNGLQVYPTVRDADGNTLSKDANGNIVDTAGRTLATKTVSGNKIYYDVLKPGGGRARYTLTTSTGPVRTVFGQSAVAEFSGTLTFVDSVELPDGTIYSFTYDRGYFGSGYYGELMGITLPTGGTVNYGYTNYQDSYRNKNRWISSRSIAGGTTTFSPAVITQCSANQTGCKEKVTVSQPEGNDTVYTLTLNNGAWNTQADHYSGRVGSSTVLLSSVSEYDQSRPCPTGVCIGAQQITNTSVTTTFPATGQTTRTEYVSDNPESGKVSKIKEWDYYIGSRPTTPARETDNSYGVVLNGASLVTQNVILDGTQTPGTQTLAAKTIYRYDASGNVTSVKQWLDDQGNLVETTSGFDDVGNKISSLDGKLNVTSFAYDDSRTCVRQITAPNTGVDHITTFTCDANTGLQVTSVDENQKQTIFTFDGMQRLSHVTYPDGGELDMQYSPTTITEKHKISASGDWTVLVKSFDSFGRSNKIQNLTGGSEVSRVDLTYDLNGRLKTQTNPYVTGQAASTDGVTTFVYDALDRVIQESEPNGKTIQFVFSGNEVTKTDENAHSRKMVVDGLGRPKSIWEPGPNGAFSWETSYVFNAIDQLLRIDQKGGSTNSSDWRTRLFTYDLLGRKTKEIVPESGETNYRYDANGNLTQKKDARNKAVDYEYDALNRVSKKSLSGRAAAYAFSYDDSTRTNAKGRLSALSNGAGYQAKFDYDEVGRTKSTTYCLPSQVGLCNQSVTAEYDLVGNLTQLKYPDGRTLKQTFDPSNRLSSVVYDSWNGQAVGTSYISGLTYAPTGQTLTAVFGNGVQRSQVFNNIFASTALEFKKGSQSLWSKQFLWDGSGTLLLKATDMLDNSHTRSFGYDQVDRLISASDLGTGGASGTGQLTIDGSLQQLSWNDCVFDGRDWICTPITIDDSGSVSATIGSLSKSVGYSSGASPSAIASSLAQSFNADPLSPVTAVANANIVTFTAKTTGASTNYLFSATTTYDSYNFSGPSFSATTSGSTLAGGVNPGGTGLLTQAFNFDAWGNLKQTGTFNFEQNFNGMNQISSGGYQYDAAGNLTDGVGRSYEWDAEGFLAQIDNAATTYDYDPNGLRVRKSSSGGSTEYLYFGGVLLAELDVSSGNWHDYVYAGASIIAEVEGTQASTPLYRIENFPGSLEGKAGSSGQSTGQASLAPFGQAIASDFNSGFIYAGLYRDIESTNDHASFRQYSSSQGRWLSPDPFAGSYNLGNPQTLNRYSYVLGNPTSLTDPDGLFVAAAGPISAGCPWCGAAIGIGSMVFKIFGLGRPRFTGSMKPRPTVAGGNFPDGESLGIPSGMSLPEHTIWQALGIVPIASCDFGPCFGAFPGDERLPGSMPEFEPSFLEKFGQCFKDIFQLKRGVSMTGGPLPKPRVVDPRQTETSLWSLADHYLGKLAPKMRGLKATGANTTHVIRGTGRLMYFVNAAYEFHDFYSMTSCINGK